ncbi:hypothetical protein BDP27DRAFT_1407494 [Rhodocollybia butyracea]|uniref:Uncharacterized protein n=1 Tax=Rhodocollybia butyracea TaxID=206335 RepID=A0A9P5TYS5_9AGAR|nr:hypothetical protein BDP27DRAFT_1407494 [Rhodocollybia butyracea]
MHCAVQKTLVWKEEFVERRLWTRGFMDGDTKRQFRVRTPRISTRVAPTLAAHIYRKRYLPRDPRPFAALHANPTGVSDKRSRHGDSEGDPAEPLVDRLGPAAGCERSIVGTLGISSSGWVLEPWAPELEAFVWDRTKTRHKANESTHHNHTLDEALQCMTQTPPKTTIFFFRISIGFFYVQRARTVEGRMD